MLRLDGGTVVKIEGGEHLVMTLVGERLHLLVGYFLFIVADHNIYYKSISHQNRN
jgi:hypothetical protein